MISTAALSVDVDGLPVGYYREGHGREIVLLHGASGHPETSFPHLLDEVMKSRTAIVPGYSGSSLTPLPEGELTVDLLAEQVLGVLRAAAHGPVDVVGFSTGAVVGAVAAAKEPGLVRRLVLSGGFAHYGHPWQRLFTRTWRRLADLDANTFAEFTLLHALSDGHLDTLAPRDRLMLRSGLMPSPGMVALVELVSRLDIGAHLPKITTPTLVLGNTRDQLVPLRYAREFHEAIPGSAYAEIDSGHLAALERPEELVAHIEDFLG
ncbi:alpha/beta hydrolase [Streptomyces sp. HNM0574]|uniref:alpha/beta fold hydrolase n=1 Tax=Streptomyces sp. HNM0574 TaxID=2714954 RepID=UPI00146DA1C3|nr:alpha/beta hydrolase [Streptomyces sp. HNM0574]NLU66106.1 alpha/beta hydrolase [Streptomyces sp. HNM0574]